MRCFAILGAAGLLLSACSGATEAEEAPGDAAPPRPSSTATPAPEELPPEPTEDGGVVTDAQSPSDAATPGENKNLGLSSGCNKAGAATGAKTLTVTIAGKERSYIRFVPPAYDPQKGVSLVLGLHGAGGTSAKARTTFDLEQASAGKAIILYPQALPSPDPKFDGSNRWDPIKDSDDYTFFDAIIKDTEESYCIDRDREFATGFSLGARMTSMLGCYRGDRLRAIAPVAPGGDSKTLPLAQGQCVGEVAVWEALGMKDTEHEEGALIVREHYRTANGCSTTKKATTPAGCEAFEGCRAGVPTVFCTYAEGHVWPDFGTMGVWNFFASFK